MADISISAKQAIKNFQMKTINNSIADLNILDNIADYLLQCCSAQAKANTLSIFSTLPLIFVTFLVPQQPNFIHYVLGFIAILLQQILDIVNKKQAYRLQTFSFGTFFFDHICDSFSIICIVYIIGRLLLIPNNWLWVCVYTFGILPFYISHLSMYYGEYMKFPYISPASEGLIILQALCVVGAICGNSIFTNKILGIPLNTIIIGLCTIWLLLYLLPNIKTIFQSNGIKNLFVIIVIGYIMFEMSVIQANTIINQESNIVFGLFIYSIILWNSLLIGQLIFKYGCNQKFMQISINVLVFTGYLVVVYAIFAFVDFQKQSTKQDEKSVEEILALIIAMVLAILQTIGYVYRNIQIKNMINQAINQ